MIRTVVVGAAGNGHRQTVGTVISQNQQICTGFGAAVRRAGVDRCLLGEEQVGTVQRQVAVNLVGRDLMITLDAVLAASVHQRCGTHNIRLEEDARIFDRTVNMRFCRKVNHNVRMLFFKQFIYSFAVADIGLHKAEIWVIHDRRQRRQVACVGQLIEADNAVIRVFFQYVKNKIGTNKSGAAGNDDRHNLTPCAVELTPGSSYCERNF